MNVPCMTLRDNTECPETIDLGAWIKMITSSFYHQLYIVQLKVMFILTNENMFDTMATKWADYFHKPINRKRALIQKIVFKVLYY